MLFDLRGRGRRRVVRVIYSGLALLFLVGFVGFGVGAVGGGGGILEALSSNKGSGELSYTKKITKDRKLTAAQPNNPQAYEALIKDLLLQAGTGENYNNTEGAFTSKAHSLLNEASQAWQRYLEVKPKNPSSDLASEMLTAYNGTGSLAEPKAALQAMQIVIAGRTPTAGLYVTLAQLAYLAGNKREGELASKKALALAPASERVVLENDLAKIKANPKGEESQGQTATVPTKGATTTGATTGATTTPGTTAPLGSTTTPPATKSTGKKK